MADIAELFCFPTSRFDCGGGSYTLAAPATYFFVDYGTESGTYFRCDAKGCDPYPIEVNPSGEFTQFIPSQGQAMLFKVATGDVLGNKGEFVDIATPGTGAIVSTGKCEFTKLFSMLYDEIQKIINPAICDSENTRVNFLKRLEEGVFTRDENPQTHYCAYFLPYNQKEKKVFIVHHKKSGLWLSPGGHIDKGEGLLETLNREIDEELGVKNFFQEPQSPFLLTITPIENKVQPCKVHYDIWYLVLTDGSNFDVDPKEFHETRWLTIEEAEKIVIDEPNRKALEAVKKKYK